MSQRIAAISMLLALASCSTTYYEVTGTCVAQEWKLASVVLRARKICDLPPPTDEEIEVRDREAMNVNPFPGVFDYNPADTSDRNLLEKRRLIKRYENSKTDEERDRIIREYERLMGT